jgi:hypothetical protein
VGFKEKNKKNNHTDRYVGFKEKNKKNNHTDLSCANMG